MNLLTSNAKLLGLVVTCSMVVLPVVLAPAPSYAAPKTTFECRTKVNGDVKEPVTVARRGDRVTEPMITWKDKSFGSTYTPEKRCQIVSQRLTKAVATSGKLSNLDMTYGSIKSVPVICYITKKGEKCNSGNILFSLKPSEKGQEQTIVAGLLNFSKLGAGGGIMRGAPGQTVATKPVTYGDAIENALKEPVNPNATNDEPN
ncbi:COP23 domain-containing protein [Chamaesiphon sp. VAR_48_metabat_403]|uniref:COP23 domain-containing protein n=1 Tax=Chamaesiphon sp. VAR_48_metabat_403 TaxID=2964700 RepID=UPI00286DFEBE|nr:COP23 domain-containing protein [Chamaesiphon sp. VAR_48_metabat_403]